MQLGLAFYSLQANKMEAIIAAALETVSGVVGLITSSKEARYGRLPDWISPADFQREDRTADIILIGMFLVLIVIIIAIARKK